MRMRWMVLATLMLPSVVRSQDANAEISKGNEAYKKQEYSKAGSFYQMALQKAPGNGIASFNLGNSLMKENKQEEAVKQYEAAAQAVRNKTEKGDALYNMGVAYTRQKKLDESIAAYKSVLRLNPSDSMARQNLQRALNEKQKKQEQPKQNKDQQPKKQPNKLNKQQVQQMLNALQEQEKQLQQRMQKSKVPAPNQPEKDW